MSRKPGTPSGTPAGTPDRRPSVTLRGPHYTAEWRATVARAAKVAGETQSDFIARAAMDAAQRVLQGKPARDEAPAPLPVVSQEVSARLDQQGEALAALTAQVEVLVAAQRSGLWGRLWRR